MSGQVLIVDGSATNRILLRARLMAAGYDVTTAADGTAALSAARLGLPDIVLTAADLADMGVDALIGQLRSDPATADIAVLAHAGPDDRQARLSALRAGAEDVLTRDGDTSALLARMRNLMRARASLSDLCLGAPQANALGLAEAAAAPPEPPGTVVLAALRPETAAGWRRGLERRLRDRLVIVARGDLAEAAAGADVILIETDPAEAGGGLQILSELRAGSLTRHAAVCLTRAVPWDNPAVAWDLEAADLVGPDPDPEELALRLANLLRRKRRADRLRAQLRDGLRLAAYDPLTGLHNRRSAQTRLAALADGARRLGQAFAVMVLDLDHFKTVNDRWGHAAGDAVLVEVARRLAANLRAGDFVARIGGEEFLVVLPATDLVDARSIAERLRQAVREKPFALPQGGVLTVTASIGLALSDCLLRDPEQPVAELIDRADQALMTAKSAGRNRVTLALSAA